MKQKTKKPTVAPVEVTVSQPVAYSQLSSDLKHSVLIVSLVANLFILTGWVALQVTTQFDAQVSSVLFTR